MEKYRIVIVNERGYSFMCEVEGEADFVKQMIETLRKGKGVAVCRADLIV